MKIYVVIPVHNRRDTTRQCLSCLSEQTATNFEVVVVNDGSSDGTSEMIHSEFPSVNVLHGDGNLWWTGAINVGIRSVLNKAEPNDYILTLNDDVSVESDFIAQLTKLAAQFPRTLIGSVFVSGMDRDTILSGGTQINWFTAKWQAINKGKLLSSFAKSYHCTVSTLTGRGVLIPVAVFQEIGLYDNAHFKQGGDTELPSRAKLAGYNLIVHYDAIVYDAESQTFDINRVDRYQWSQWRNFFWGIRSNYNLTYRYWFARNTQTSYIQGTIYYVSDLFRVMFRFVRGVLAK